MNSSNLLGGINSNYKSNFGMFDPSYKSMIKCFDSKVPIATI